VAAATGKLEIGAWDDELYELPDGSKKGGRFLSMVTNEAAGEGSPDISYNYEVDYVDYELLPTEYPCSTANDLSYQHPGPTGGPYWDAFAAKMPVDGLEYGFLTMSDDQYWYIEMDTGDGNVNWEGQFQDFKDAIVASGTGAMVFVDESGAWGHSMSGTDQHTFGYKMFSDHPDIHPGTQDSLERKLLQDGVPLPFGTFNYFWECAGAGECTQTSGNGAAVELLGDGRRKLTADSGLLSGPAAVLSGYKSSSPSGSVMYSPSASAKVADSRCKRRQLKRKKKSKGKKAAKAAPLSPTASANVC